MSATATDEQTTAFLAELARIQAQVREKRQKDPNYGVIGRTNPQRLEEMFGMFANDPHAEAVLRSIEETREKEREEARREPAEDDTI